LNPLSPRRYHFGAGSTLPSKPPRYRLLRSVVGSDTDLSPCFGPPASVSPGGFAPLTAATSQVKSTTLSSPELLQVSTRRFLDFFHTLHTGCIATSSRAAAHNCTSGGKSLDPSQPCVLYQRRMSSDEAGDHLYWRRNPLSFLIQPSHLHFPCIAYVCGSVFSGTSLVAQPALRISRRKPAPQPIASTHIPTQKCADNDIHHRPHSPLVHQHAFCVVFP
jgi:hypothetical protein